VNPSGSPDPEGSHLSFFLLTIKGKTKGRKGSLTFYFNCNFNLQKRDYEEQDHIVMTSEFDD